MAATFYKVNMNSELAKRKPLLLEEVAAASDHHLSINHQCITSFLVCFYLSIPDLTYTYKSFILNSGVKEGYITLNNLLDAALRAFCSRSH